MPLDTTTAYTLPRPRSPAPVLRGPTPHWPALRSERRVDVFGALAAAPEMLRRWRDRLRERDALAAMQERDLRDIGITAYDAAMESRKPFWRG